MVMNAEKNNKKSSWSQNGFLPPALLESVAAKYELLRPEGVSRVEEMADIGGEGE